MDRDGPVDAGDQTPSVSSIGVEAIWAGLFGSSGARWVIDQYLDGYDGYWARGDDTRADTDSADAGTTHDLTSFVERLVRHATETSSHDTAVVTLSGSDADVVIVPEEAFSGSGQQPLTSASPPGIRGEMVADGMESKTGLYAKLHGGLADLHGANQGALVQQAGTLSQFTTVAENVTIDAVVDFDAAPELLAELTELGLLGGTSIGNVISGALPVDALGALAQLDGLEFVRPSYAVADVGLTTSQADLAMNADLARATFGVDGTGVTIGVLSDSFNNLGGAAADIASGDLPAGGVTVLDDIAGGGSDEGRAMLQLVHDVAPGADLAFHTAFTGQAGFAQGIIDLANAGSDVIVDDVIYFAEPFFQDGIIAQAVDQVVAGGASYFSSAGNQSRDSYESAFNLSSSTLEGTFLHDFGGGDVFQSLTIDGFSTFTLSFQWDQPFASGTAPGSPGSSSDFDIFILDSSASTVLFRSTANNVGGDPFEFFQITNSGAATTVNLAIGYFSGPDPDLMKYVIFGGGSINEHDTNSATSFGHNNAEGAIAVGAARFDQTPRFGTDPAILEPFSSAGVTPILFDATGNRLAQPEIRSTVDIVAPDGTNTTFFGNDSGIDADSFPNFFGTSAAAPHAAAVAALMLEAAPGSSPDDIYASLTSTALDMNDPATPGFDTGYDVATGFGLIQADLAIADLLGPAANNPPTDFSLSASSVPENAANGTVVGTFGSVVDADAGDSHSFSLQDSAGGRFQIVGDELRVLDGSLLDFEDTTSHQVTVRVTDDGAPSESFDKDFTIGVIDVPEGGNPVTLIDASFGTGAEGFVYVDDTFRGTNQPTFADGSHTDVGGAQGGVLQVLLGGINGDDILGMSGGWQQNFALAAPTQVTVSFDYNLTIASGYESDERARRCLAWMGP